jgi:uncharacterized protein YegP (UPF0339 family)
METNVVRIVTFQGQNDEWYWHAQAANNEIVASSSPESYTRKEDAARAAEAVFPGIPVDSE